MMESGGSVFLVSILPLQHDRAKGDQQKKTEWIVWNVRKA